MSSTREATNKRRRELRDATKDADNKKRRHDYAKRKKDAAACTSSTVSTKNDGRTRSGKQMSGMHYEVLNEQNLSHDHAVLFPVFYSFQNLPDEPFVLPANIICEHCYAKKLWKEPKGFCCMDGQVKLCENEMPDDLCNLFIQDTSESLEFRTISRSYNNHFAFTSFGVKYDKDLCRMNKGIYTFRIQGQVHHYINSLLPKELTPSYLQLYFYDTDNEIDNRLNSSDRFSANIVQKLIDILRINPYSQFFRSLQHYQSIETITINLQSNPSLDQRVYNKPTASQVAGIWVENDPNNIATSREIRVHSHSNRSHRINNYYGCYDPLQYPLLFPFGDIGWHEGIQRSPKSRISNMQQLTSPFSNNPTSVEALLLEEESVLTKNHQRTQISLREYYCYKLQIRVTGNSFLLHTGRLFQQYVVDMYVKIESARLDFFRNNQKQIRADLYQGIVDSVHNGVTRGSQIGKRIILPASFIGGPRDNRKRYMDAMALVQRFGKPDIFLTMTCNPNWPEIKQELLHNDVPHNRPDLISRVFKAKLEELKNDIVKKEVFGPVATYIYVVEFQKRGLPHAHFLIILKNGHKITTREAIDKIVCCEIPFEETFPYLRSRVVKHMMHGPCGTLNPSNVCMDDQRNCKNKYPKPFVDQTTIGKNSYPTYRRRDTGEQLKIRGHYLDNKWVIPYNPFLLAKYDCHINVEVCSTVKAIKYLYKYVYKGHDRVIFSTNESGTEHEIDEISQFQSARWISAPEAIWRIYSFDPSENFPSVISLQLHLENEQTITFNESQNLANIIDNDFLQRTMLTEFFRMNTIDSKARTLLYKEFPIYYVWDRKIRRWTPRKKKQVIGRIISANPCEGERYYLRILLNHVRGPRSHNDLKKVNKVQLKTFREAASTLGLLNEDINCQLCMSEAILYQMPNSLRRLFATILIFCAPSNPQELWLAYKEFMMEDYIKQNLSPTEAETKTLKCINNVLELSGKNINDYGLVSYSISLTEEEKLKNMVVEETTQYTTQLYTEDIVDKLNADQKAAYDAILNKVLKKENGLFFVDGPGGTGKTFLYKALLTSIRKNGLVALATASSGVAASLLPGGRTAHSRFKIPLEITPHISCSITKQSALGKLIIMSTLIIWDEAPMVHRFAIEAVHRLLQDLMENNLPFGGKVLVFGGDFQQILPVIPKGSKDDILQASLIFSELWPCFTRISLVQNMRAQTDIAFSKYLLLIGNGDIESHFCNMIELLPEIVLPYEDETTSLNLLIDHVFPSTFFDESQMLTMVNRVVLTPKNENVDLINNMLLHKLDGEKITYYSYDEPIDKTEHDIHEDYLNTITPNGIPPHELVLKKNCPVLLLRNINPSEGLCNGTRLLCRQFNRNVIDAEITTGEYSGKRVLLPRIPFIPLEDDTGSVPFKRTQFPIRPCFAMTINKAQGQTLDYIGLYLPEPVFSHGQLYVALSRARKSANIKVLVKPLPDVNRKTHTNCTTNVVYKEALQYL